MMDKRITGKRILTVLLLVLLGLEVCMELRYPCDELSVTSRDTGKLLRRTPEVVITEEDRALMADLTELSSVKELLENEENGDIGAWENPEVLAAAEKRLDKESAESLNVSTLFSEDKYVVFAGWREGKSVFYLQEGPEEGMYYKFYRPKRGTSYENWDNERAQKSETHRRWFAWLRDGMWKDEA